jgi:hypothetical protein
MRSVLSIVTALTFLLTSVPMAVAGGIVAGVGDGPGVRAVAPPTDDITPQGLVNFDGVGAPCLFQDTTALKAFDGVTFKGTGDVRNGGAILNECSDFGVTGHSSPNFLAFNCDAVMSDGGSPRLPETILLPGEFTNVSLKVGRFDPPFGKILKLIGKGSLGKEVHVVTLDNPMQTVTFTVPVHKIKLKSAKKTDPVCRVVVDDLSF